MRKLTLAAAALATSALTAVSPALADGHQKVVDDPLELTIHFHWARSKGYIEDWPVEKAACAATILLMGCSLTWVCACQRHLPFPGLGPLPQAKSMSVNLSTSSSASLTTIPSVQRRQKGNVGIQQQAN